MARRPDLDDDDWVGEPPEGFYTADRADPGFWTGRKPLEVAAFGVGVALLVLVLVLVLA
ncbi:MAG: hypothetical protein M3375_00320 [Actinomycetota bacterium]|nr:hypothetical protein [Actinomycetota bacterium]